MIGKIIRKDFNALQIYGATAGALAGLVLLLSVLQFYFDLGEVVRENKDLIDPEYIVINKKVSILETFNLKEATFSEKEIKKISNQAWAEKVEGFISNQFALSAYAESKRFPDFYTDLFFESVPDQYLDVKDPEWKWNPRNDLIPIILPREYLNLYNFGFASSQGLPQISPETVSLVNFNILIRGQGKSAEYRAKIIGFSDRINSILVPYRFLSWANAEYGNQNQKKISRIVIETQDPTNPEIISFLEGEGYETLKEKLKSSRLNIILKIIISILGSLGFFIILLAFMVFTISFQLMISRSKDQIRKLKFLGYHYSEISRPYIKLFTVIVTGIGVITSLILWALRNFLREYFIRWNIHTGDNYNLWVGITGLGLLIIILLINAYTITRITRKI